MATLPTLRVDGVPLQFVDLRDARLGPGQGESVLQGLTEVHLRHFADYPHMLGEFQEYRHGWHDPDTDVHAWLALRGNLAVGEFVVHTNTRRGMSLFHFFAVDAAVRHEFPRGWLGHVARAFLTIGGADCRRRGRHLLGGMCEVPDDHVRKWTRLGYAELPVDYAEPAGGRFHRLPVRFIPQRPMLFTTPAATALPAGVVAGQALRAFLLDYYGLPETNPHVAAMLEQARAGRVAS